MVRGWCKVFAFLYPGLGEHVNKPQLTQMSGHLNGAAPPVSRVNPGAS